MIDKASTCTCIYNDSLTVYGISYPTGYIQLAQRSAIGIDGQSVCLVTGGGTRGSR